ncbi:hypothetical protein BDZ94DRAFT_1323092 [Collybia nuda]|uniref:DUF6697 domain-containing protein n=1 Tax=Collybia nuda TaxID=64659 RepID=A0A9P6CDM1_9AGAR|nr:hypothetical protein BDZ94DRAFT_1323092 [Collybia nuda]
MQETTVPPRPSITTPKPQDIIALPTSGSRGSAPSPSPAPTSERIKPRCLPIPPFPDVVKNRKRGIEQLQCVAVTKQNKKQKVTKGQSDGCNEVPSGPKSIAGSPISAVDKSQNNGVTASSSLVVRSTLGRVSNRQKNIMVKPEALRLPDATVSEYLKGCARLPINPAPKKLLVSRQFIGEMYGGSQFTLLATSTDKSRNFIFPTPDINPDMPTIPGNPGLLLSCRREMTQVICTLFSRNETKPARWEYIGEYESRLLRQLSALEFTQQTQAMKNAWAKKIIKVKKWPVYTGIRARIFLRKDGQALTDENVEAEILRITSKATQSGALNASDVIKALERGEEQLDIIRMTCVSYDHRFVKDIITQSKSWTQKSPNGKGTSKHKAGKGKKKTVQMDSESSDSDS